MNISRLTQQSASVQPAQVRPFQAPKSTSPERGVDTKPHSTHHTSQGTSAAKAQGVEAGDDGVEPHDYSARVANYASQIDTRVQNAIQSGNLSEEQVQALQDASAQFQQLMERIGNADFAKSPKRQVLFALHQLGQQIQAILHPEETNPTATSTLTGGSDVAGASAAPTIDAVA